MSIILASASPRRRELLTMVGLDFIVCPAGNETEPQGLSMEETVEMTALSKALEVSEKYADDIVIAADTLVFVDGEKLGKPTDEQDAFLMLKKLSGKTHYVCTGVAVKQGEKVLKNHEKAAVHFAQMSDDDIMRYIATGEPMDKAGAYGIQGKGAVFIKGIDGDFFNVMGLPMHLLSEMLAEFGIILV